MAPLTRRRSARLASNGKPTGVASTPGLDSLAEQNEELPSSPMLPPPQTPAGSSPTKPSRSEMRPRKANGPKAPPSSALRLGFADIETVRQDSPTTAKSNKIAASATLKAAESPEQLTSTPSKNRSPLSAISPFTFRFSRAQEKSRSNASGSADGDAVLAKDIVSPTNAAGTPDLGLSDEARRMMEELRGEAQKIRADLELQREQENARQEQDEDEALVGRRIAKPRNRTGRYSAAHSAEFDKMDSIANHPSAFRIARFTPVKSVVTPSCATTNTPAIASQARGLKRTQSKANLDETPISKSVLRTPASAAVGMSTTKKPLNSVPTTNGKPLQSARKGNILFPSNDEERPVSTAKRIKQNVGDDASSSRHLAHVDSSLPRPMQLERGMADIGRSHTAASLLTPTKASLLTRSTSVKGLSANGATSLPPKTPSKTPIKSPLQLFSALKKSATTSSLQSAACTPPIAATRVTHTANGSKPLIRAADSIKTTVATLPSATKLSFQANTRAARTALPGQTSTGVVTVSKTPAPPRIADRVLPPRVPATTPRQKLVKHVAFTPGTERAVLSVKSPSLFRSGIPRSALKSHTRPQDSDMAVDDTFEASAGSPSIRRRFGATIFYPDLSGHELLGGPKSDSQSKNPLAPSATLAPPPSSPSLPGTFTFRSDKTIQFGQTSPTGFGSSPGQVSLRQVRPSTSTARKIPGSFPEISQAGDTITTFVPTDGPDKENTRPMTITNIPHGIANKKRHRVSEADEVAEEEAKRAAKKRKNAASVPEGEALLAPRLAGKTMPVSTTKNASTGVRSTPYKHSLQKSSPVKTKLDASSTFSAAPSPSKTPGSVVKKRPMLTMSRLNNLSRPKLRK
ncbi:MAG: hypothetical protein SEPTF4163_004409 [Sporothrix epigloea]